MVAFGQTGCSRANWLYSGKVVLFVQKWLYSLKRACIRAKVNVVGQSGFIEAKVVLIGRVVVIKQSCCSRAVVVLFGKK